jgi:DNA adenine methylase
MATPPFPYFGGKQTLATRIVERLPQHGHYVEPFAGSLSVLLAKPRSTMETVNDLDGDLMNFWRVLREQPEELARVCALTPHARDEHQQSYDRPLELTDLERARRVWVCLTQGRGGMLRRTGWRHYGDASVSTGMPDYLGGYVQRLLPAAARLAGVSLECRPALEVIEKYGRSEGVLLYVDPPYLGSTRIWGNQYRHEMRTEDDHRELAEALRACNAQVVLSGYDSELYAELYAGWDTVHLPTSTGNGRQGERARLEVLWSNRAISHPTLFDEVAS